MFLRKQQMFYYYYYYKVQTFAFKRVRTIPYSLSLLHTSRGTIHYRTGKGTLMDPRKYPEKHNIITL